MSFQYFKSNHKYFLLLICCYFAALTSCEKFVTVDTPDTSLSEANVYKDDVTASAVLTGIYTRMSSSNSFNSIGSNVTAMSYYPALSSDELTLYSGVSNVSLLAYYRNALKVENNAGSNFWNAFYPIIYKANAALEGLTQSASLTPSVRKQLLGEAYFIRAFCYFYLVNLYGDVPLALTSNYEMTSLLPRAKPADVYKQIVADLQEAQVLLSDYYLDGTLSTATLERVRPNKWVATALLARVYLYTKDYVNSEIQASVIIDNKSIYDTVPLNEVFKMNSSETIWSLQPVNATTAQNTGEGRLFILRSSGPTSSTTNPVYLSEQLINSFQAGDNRLAQWTKRITVSGKPYDYAFKYKIGAVDVPTQEYVVVMRLAEQYLIRSEARAKQGKITALDDLNIIRKRAGLQDITTSDMDAITDSVINERKIELFTEWGHRWLDLKRVDKINATMNTITPLKGGTWDDRWALYPIPVFDINRDPNLKQNPGYE